MDAQIPRNIREIKRGTRTMTFWEFRNLVQHGTKIHIYEELTLGPYILPIPQMSIIVSPKETKTKYDDWTVTYI